jgi:hypothetical protein
MLAITPHMKILVAIKPADFRNYAELAVMPSPPRTLPENKARSTQMLGIISRHLF